MQKTTHAVNSKFIYGSWKRDGAGKCGVSRSPDLLKIAEGKFENAERDLTKYLNNWKMIEEL
jgi:hypothetical protein